LLSAMKLLATFGQDRGSTRYFCQIAQGDILRRLYRKDSVTV